MVKQLLWICLIALSGVIQGQSVQSDTLTAYVTNGDTLYIHELPEVNVLPKPRTEFKNRRQRRYYGRLLRDVKKTLPYAKMAGEMLVQVNDSLQTIPTQKGKNNYLKTVEKALFSEYEPVLRKMSMRQGRVFIKLIDRECQVTSYEVVQIYRGNFSAFFWQGVARVFGSDLKSDYDALGDDLLMEEIVLLVEAGLI